MTARAYLPWTADEITRMATLRDAGASQREMAAALQRSLGSVKGAVFELLPPGRNQVNTPWTADRTERLELLWRQGVSAGIIARSLDYPFSRSAVMGKIHRMGLVGVQSQTSVRGLNKPRHERRRGRPPVLREKRPRPPAHPLLAIYAVTVEPGALRTVLTVGPKECRWVTDVATPAAMCGHPVTPGYVYCAHHAHRAYRTADAQPVKRDRRACA